MVVGCVVVVVVGGTIVVVVVVAASGLDHCVEVVVLSSPVGVVDWPAPAPELLPESSFSPVPPERGDPGAATGEWVPVAFAMVPVVDGLS